ncbi:MAG: DNA mismatch repair protein MutS [Phycisphaerales bacterium]|nr:DNA mismatch repair protein MutS [Phycisphaerales bacterium]
MPPVDHRQKAPRVSPPDEARLTPAMRQYWEQKQQVPDAILLFRMGDFYEMFYDDAELGARVLGITLTSRDNGRTALAGIPHHALDNYLAKLVAAGYKVAISEQIEEARVARGVVDRAVVRIVTPGTLTDEGLLERTRSNILAAVVEGEAGCGLAVLELASGRFVVQVCPTERLLDELNRADAAEVLLPEPASGRDPREADVRNQVGAVVTYRSAADFAPARAGELLREHFETVVLEGFGFHAIDASLQAAGGLVAYVRETQRAAARHLQPPRRADTADFMTLDAVTLRSLEIERTLRTGRREGSLLAAVDRTTNPMGARLLRQWLCYPLRDLGAIEERQRAVAALRADSRARDALRAALGKIGDIERIIGRLGVLRATPRDLRALGNGLVALRDLRTTLATLRSAACERWLAVLEGLDERGTELVTTLAAEPPATLREGGIFAAGYHAELDRLRGIQQDGQHWLAQYQAREVKRTGIASLKVAFNKVFGFYIEITNTHRNRVPADYVRKQTMKNAERYITEELKRYEAEALSAEARAHDIEYELFVALREALVPEIPALQSAARALAELDVLAGWAELASQRHHCRPVFVAEPVLELRGGRHPVLDLTLDTHFVANDTALRAGQHQALALITGPNMAGKSTYIRQVALLTLLAHCGAWVPAEAMQLGLVDRIFTRVGAADELARGQSTFMVEMVETANILHHATSHSLVILDEIGRGTSTFDGVALAWAITEHLATRCGSRTLFATHYHELTELSELLEPVFNLNVAVRKYEDQVVFLHRIVPGAAGRSYGLHVAKLAGVPRNVLERANAVLNELERTFARESQRPALAAVQRRRLRQLRLFEEPEETIVRELRELDAEAAETGQLVEKIQAWRRLLGSAASAANQAAGG